MRDASCELRTPGYEPRAGRDAAGTTRRPCILAGGGWLRPLIAYWRPLATGRSWGAGLGRRRGDAPGALRACSASHPTSFAAWDREGRGPDRRKTGGSPSFWRGVGRAAWRNRCARIPFAIVRI